jgi:small subunit ribosomal protein S18
MPKVRRRKPRGDKPEKKQRKKARVPGIEQVPYIDYKDVAMLRNFMSERAKIRARRVTGLSRRRQREIAVAIKNAREMALLPYTNK